MRIGIDCRMYSSRFTGIGRYVFELTQHLFQIDHENEYVLFFNEPEFSLFHPPNHRVKKVLVNAPHYSFSEQIRFLRILWREKLDLMHFTHFNAPIFYTRPSIVTIHDLTLSFFPGKKMTSLPRRFGYHLALEVAVRKAKKIIAVSRNTVKDLQQLFKISSEKISVMYLGINKNFKILENQKSIEAVKKKYHIEKPYLLYTGVWRSHKNIPNLIEAFRILKEEYLFDGQLVITGRHDPLYAPEIFQKISTLKNPNDVITPGLVDEKELVELYNGASVYVFPSLYEGFGLPPLEAMQCGIPVAASRSSCIPEVCGQDNALFFNPHHPRDIAEKVFEVLSQKTLREKLIANGLKHVQSFSWEKMAKETLQIYNSISH